MDPFVAEIRIFPFNFSPRGWAWCDGQLLPLSQNTALFSLLGTTYGGDGRSTFALPDLQGRAPMHPGQGPGLSFRDLGEASGTETVTLLQTEMPQHNHMVAEAPEPGEATSPSGNTISVSQEGNVYVAGTPNKLMSSKILPMVGDNNPHNNLQPYLTTYFCIAMQGVFPPRS
jgi:microcystin-dependent protein